MNERADAADGEDARSSYLQLYINPSYEFSDPYLISLRMEAVKEDLSAEESKTDFTMVRPSFRFLRFKPTSEISTSTSVRVTLPANSKARFDKTFRGGVSLAQSLELTRWQFSAGLSVQQNSHEQKILNEGKENEAVNTDKNTALELKKVFTFTSKLSFEVLLSYIASWDYVGEMSERYIFVQALNYDVTSNWGFYGAHFIDRSLFTYDDEGYAKNNFQAAHPVDSYFGLGVYYSF